MNVRTAIDLWCPDWSRADKQRIGLRGLLGDVRVNFDADLRTTFGKAYVERGCVAIPATARIELHPKLLLEAEIHIRLILLHEVAHLIAHPATGHGKLWKYYATSFGTPAVRHYPYAYMLRHVPRPAKVGRFN